MPGHLALLTDRLCQLARGDIKRLMVFMPPRHGKSFLCSQYFPAWYIGAFRGRVILTSYEATFAASWGRLARNVLTEWGPSVFGVRVAQDSSAADHWELEGAEGQRGVMHTAGVGGAITGRGASLLIIDDPVKNMEEAQSPTYRDKAWQWYTSTAYTRLEPDGRVLIIQCMTGDTPVLRPDGTTTPLRDVRPGDAVATYENGRLSSSTVAKWAHQGSDVVYTIRMKSGTVVRANARHPFLTIQDGEEVWQRTDTLKKGSLILRVTGANGAELPAQQTDVTSLLNARGYAIPTTARRAGQQGIVLLPSTPNRGGPHISSTAMGLAPRNTTALWLRKMGAALFVYSHRRIRILAPTGVQNSALTMTMTPERCAGCSAMTAILPLDMAPQPNASALPLSTWSVTPDEVLDVAVSGIEDVYDLQIDRTENFIANGLVSHNTRWHNDDLSGRILSEAKAQGDTEPWHVLSLPAIAATDENYPIAGDTPFVRREGEPLWPERFSAERLAAIRTDVGGAVWSALYQQQPAPESGYIWRREWFKRYSNLGGMPEFQRIVQAVDTAFKTGIASDYSVIATWGCTANAFYLIDVWRAQVEYPELKRAIADQYAKHHPAAIYIEDAASGQSVIQELQRETRLPVLAIRPQGSKEARAAAVTPLAEAGKVFIPDSVPWVADWIDEHVAFPRGAHDDMVDTTSIALDQVQLRTITHGPKLF